MFFLVLIRGTTIHSGNSIMSSISCDANCRSRGGKMLQTFANLVLFMMHKNRSKNCSVVMENY